LPEKEEPHRERQTYIHTHYTHYEREEKEREAKLCYYDEVIAVVVATR
jgi:hypothetical protein